MKIAKIFAGIILMTTCLYFPRTNAEDAAPLPKFDSTDEAFHEAIFAFYNEKNAARAYQIMGKALEEFEPTENFHMHLALYRSAFDQALNTNLPHNHSKDGLKVIETLKQKDKKTAADYVKLMLLIPIGGKIKEPESIGNYCGLVLKEHPTSPWCLWARYTIVHEDLLHKLRGMPTGLIGIKNNDWETIRQAIYEREGAGLLPGSGVTYEEVRLAGQILTEEKYAKSYMAKFLRYQVRQIVSCVMQDARDMLDEASQKLLEDLLGRLPINMKNLSRLEAAEDKFYEFALKYDGNDDSKTSALAYFKALHEAKVVLPEKIVLELKRLKPPKITRVSAKEIKQNEETIITVEGEGLHGGHFYLKNNEGHTWAPDMTGGIADNKFELTFNKTAIPADAGYKLVVETVGGETEESGFKVVP